MSYRTLLSMLKLLFLCSTGYSLASPFYEFQYKSVLSKNPLSNLSRFYLFTSLRNCCKILKCFLIKTLREDDFMTTPKWTILEIIELILAINKMLWGAIFLLPGNVFSQGTYELHAIYAQDWLWGIFLLVISSLTVFGPPSLHIVHSKHLHFLSWAFWLGIIILLSSRLFANGISATDFLLISPYTVIALLHATLYARLSGATWTL